MALTQSQKDEDLIVVAAVEEYGRAHGMLTRDVIDLFNRLSLFPVIRDNYDVLHTTDLGEAAAFVEEYIESGSHDE